jgi:hypothetical protein
MCNLYGIKIHDFLIRDIISRKEIDYEKNNFDVFGNVAVSVRPTVGG